jgi:hypothetical protein
MARFAQPSRVMKRHRTPTENSENSSFLSGALGARRKTGTSSLQAAVTPETGSGM